MKKLLLTICCAFIALALISGCATEEPSPAAPYVSKGTIIPVADPFRTSPSDTASRAYYVYLPPGYDDQRWDAYPVVYLLNGFGGNEGYFVALFSTTDAADWLLAQHEIQPMILVFPSGHTAMGGSFYTDSWHPTVGASEQHILDVIAEVDANYHTDHTPGGRGICGHSMGGYGAMRIALKHANTFSAVAAYSAPISFWGTKTTPPHTDTTYAGLEELFPAVLLETNYDSVLAATAGVGDAAAFQQMMYPSPSRRVTSMIFAVAAAFSPTNPAAPGGTTIAAYGVDLPLGINGQLDMTTWLRWMANDPVSMFAGGLAANLANVKVYLDAGAADDLGLYGAHQVFAGALAGAGMPPDVLTTFPSIPDGAGGIVEADHTTMTFERMKVMLKWFSEQL